MGGHERELGQDSGATTMTTLRQTALMSVLGWCLACARPAPSSEQAVSPASSPAEAPGDARPTVSRAPAPPALRCQTNSDCSWEPGPAICTVGTHNPTAFLDFGGDHCGCEPTTGQCQHTRFEPVSCQTDDDCGYSRDPVLHPTASTTPRARPFRPCLDGEVDSVCGTLNDGKYCRVEVWAC